MSRSIGWFSAGAASAVVMKLVKPDIIAYCETGSEDIDNHRFLEDCEEWFGQEVMRLKNPKFNDTWEVWEKRRYISGIAGAPCTSELKINPRLKFQKPDDIHYFGYTADARDAKRIETLKENWPELDARAPLVEQGITKAACLAIIQTAGIKPPRVYAMGYPNANCIPCVKAQSPDYWSLVRREHPAEFERMSKLSRELGARLARIDGERIFIDEIPEGWPTTKPLAPECDFLCSIAEQEIFHEKENA